MKRLALVRHGRTAWNDEQRIQGRLDIPLSPEGRESVDAIRGFLAACSPTALYCSPVRRAVESAEIIAYHLGLEIVVCEEFTELNVGEWQGMVAADLAQIDSWQQYQADASVARPKGGESIRELQNRAVAGVKAIVDSGVTSCVIVTHGDVIRAIACHYLGRALRELHEFRVPLGSVLVLELLDGVTTSVVTCP